MLSILRISYEGGRKGKEKISTEKAMKTPVLKL